MRRTRPLSLAPTFNIAGLHFLVKGKVAEIQEFLVFFEIAVLNIIIRRGPIGVNGWGTTTWAVAKSRSGEGSGAEACVVDAEGLFIPLRCVSGF